MVFGTNVLTHTQLSGHQAGDLAVTDSIGGIFAHGALGGTDASAGGEIMFDFFSDLGGILKFGLLGVDSSLIFESGLGTSANLTLDIILDGTLLVHQFFDGQVDILGAFGFSDSIYNLGLLGSGAHSLTIDYQFGGLFDSGSAFFGEFAIL